MAKMLGQDLFTQEEFDAFKDGEFDKVVSDLVIVNDTKVDKLEVQGVVDKIKKDINTLYIAASIMFILTVSNLGILFALTQQLTK